MTTMATQISSLTVVYSIVYSDADQRKHQSSASLSFVREIHRDRWIPRTNGQLRGKCFHLMTSSWLERTYDCPRAIIVTLNHMTENDQRLNSRHFSIHICDEYFRNSKMQISISQLLLFLRVHFTITMDLSNGSSLVMGRALTRINHDPVFGRHQGLLLLTRFTFNRRMHQ